MLSGFELYSSWVPLNKSNNNRNNNQTKKQNQK